MKRQGLSVFLAMMVFLSNCSTSSVSDSIEENNDNDNEKLEVVNFNRDLDNYEPKKSDYNFYFTYKLTHPWWDAVLIGMDDAISKYEEKGINISYEYLAPVSVSVDYQISQMRYAASGDFDVIGVDVANPSVIGPVIDELIDSGSKVMTFSSSDAPDSKRIAYVGNTHNYEDGVTLTEALCEKLNYEGKVAILVGDENVPCHEDRAHGAHDVISKYPKMEVVAIEYDHDSIDEAYTLTKDILEKYPDLDGMVCCNMSNPVGTARCLIDNDNDHVVVVGMDHYLEALRYLRDGIIYCLGVQDCYSIGFDTIEVAIKIADGNSSGDLFDDKVEESTTFIYQDEAKEMIATLYGEVSDE